MKVSFAIPNYKNPELLEACLKSLREYHQDQECVVIDDGSPDKTPELIKPICKKYNAKLLTSFWNNGFSHAVNRGISGSSSDIVILVNSDITFTCRIDLEVIKKFKEDDRIGIVGCLLFYPNKRVQHGGFLRLQKYDITHEDYQKKLDECNLALKDRYILGVTGAVIAIRKKMTDEIGVFKTNYSLAYEDVELCIRAWHCGWRCFYLSNISAIHHEGFTRGRTQAEKIKAGTWEKEIASVEQRNRDFATYNLDRIEREVKKCNDPFMAKEKALFVRWGALGDCILMTGIISEYRRQNPSVEIDVMTGYTYPFENHPDVDNLVNWQSNKTLYEDYNVIFNFDLAYEESPQAFRLSMMARVVFDNYNMNNIKPMVYTRSSDKDSALLKLASVGIKPNEKFIVIHPCSTWPCRTLDQEKWSWLVRHSIQLGIKVVMVGTSKDIQPNPYRNFINLTDQLTLGEVKEVIHFSECFVGMDSGLMHIAFSTETPVIAVFTSADPATVIWREQDVYPIVPERGCKFCQTYLLPPPVDKVECDKLVCINNINLNQIILKIRELTK